jgi:hypothetical protein
MSFRYRHDLPLFHPHQRVVTCGITAPVEQSALSVNVETTLTAYATDTSTVEFFQDGVSIGVGTPVGSGVFSLSWTPSTVDYSTQLTAVADGMVTSAARTIVVAESNNISQTMSGWSKSTGVTITGGQTDPFGGTGAYLYTMPTVTNANTTTSKAATVTPTEINGGFEIWAKPVGVTKILIYPNDDGAVHSGHIDITNNQKRTRGAYVHVVERRPDGWCRIWFRFCNATAAGPKSFAIYFESTLGVGQATFAGGEQIYLYAPRTLDGVIPMTTYQKLAIYYISTTNGVELWNWTSPYSNSEADVNNTMREAFVIKPTGWSSSGAYKVLFALSPIGKGVDHTETVFYDGGFADTYNCVIVVPYTPSTSSAWFGCKADGTTNDDAVITEHMVPFAQNHLAVAIGRENTLAIGYSKTASGALSFILRRPDIFGYVALWDFPYAGDWSEISGFGGSTAFTTEANWNTYDPKQILAANLASVSDKTRIVLHGYCTFGTAYHSPDEQLVCKADFDANGVSCSYDRTHQAAHSWTSGWLPGAVSALFTIANA